MSASVTLQALTSHSDRDGTEQASHVGWWKAPIMFLPSGWLTPVLPPTEESTWAITVVGTCRSTSLRCEVLHLQEDLSPSYSGVAPSSIQPTWIQLNSCRPQRRLAL